MTGMNDARKVHVGRVDLVRGRGGSDTQEIRGNLPSRMPVIVPWFLDIEKTLRLHDGEHEVRSILAEYTIDVHVEINTDDPKRPV